MKNDWLKDIHDKMADYEVDAPAGLWESISQAQTQVDIYPVGRRRASLWPSFKRYCAAAAMLALLFAIGYLVYPGSDDASELLPQNDLLTHADVEDSVSHDSSDSNDYDLAEEQAVSTAVKELKAPSVTAPQHVEAVYAIDKDADGVADQQPVANSSSSNVTTEKDTPVQRNQPDAKRRETYPKDYLALNRTNKNSSSRLSVGLFTSGSAGASQTGLAAVDMMTGIGPDAAAWEDSPLLGILLFNKGTEVKTKTKHRLPIRTGVSVAYSLNDRLSIETGLTYTFLSSDMSEGSDSHYFKGEQRLHYVGIPLGMKYKIFSWRRFQIYASAGVLGEKCVDGKTKKKYILNNQIEKTDTENLYKKPFQWSLNASAGLQFDITKEVGLYAEPGLSYYFDDHTAIQTIYKDKPLNFNLHLGLRLTLGK